MYNRAVQALTPTAKLMYLYLYPKGRTYLSISELERRLGVTDHAVETGFKRLKAGGYLSIHGPRGGGIVEHTFEAGGLELGDWRPAERELPSPLLEENVVVKVVYLWTRGLSEPVQVRETQERLTLSRHAAAQALERLTPRYLKATGQRPRLYRAHPRG